MLHLHWLKQLSTPLFGRTDAARMAQNGWQARKRPLTLLSLEILEERCLLDANPQLQLSADIGKMGFDMTRAAIDGAVVADIIADASGVGTPEGIAALAALAPLIKAPAAASDLVSLLKDSREGNIAGVVGDALSLAGDEFYAIAGDMIALTQDGTAVADDLAHVLSGTPIPAPPPPVLPTPSASPTQSPTPSPSIVGTYSATVVPTYTFPTDPFGNVSSNTPQKVTLTLNADGSGSLSVSPFDGTPLTVAFPAGTAQFPNGSTGNSFYIGNPEYDSPDGAYIYAYNGALSQNGNAITVSIGAGNEGEAGFENATLNRQG